MKDEVEAGRDTEQLVDVTGELPGSSDEGQRGGSRSTRIMKTFILSVGVVLLLFVACTVAVTARYESVHVPVEPVPDVAIPDGAAERLARSLRIRTISSEDPAAFDATPFRALHAYLEAVFPRVHARLRRQTVGTHSLLYEWPVRSNRSSASAAWMWCRWSRH